MLFTFAQSLGMWLHIKGERNTFENEGFFWLETLMDTEMHWNYCVPIDASSSFYLKQLLSQMKCNSYLPVEDINPKWSPEVEHMDS